MKVYGKNLRWLAALAVLLMVFVFAACPGARTAIPSPTPVVAPTSIPLSTATPRPAPTPLPTPDFVSQTYAYAAACSNITAKFNFTIASFANGLRWAELVALADANVGGYSLLYPPPDLVAYNTAQINLLTALRDRALADRSDGVIIQDIARALGGAVPQGAAELSPAGQQALAQFFGPQFVQAFLAQQAAIGGLSSDLQGLLEEANCTVHIG